MITVVPTDQIYLCCGATDMRRGINSLARMVQQVLAQNPHLCIGRDYVAASAPTAVVRHVAASSRHII